MIHQQTKISAVLKLAIVNYTKIYQQKQVENIMKTQLAHFLHFLMPLLIMDDYKAFV